MIFSGRATAFIALGLSALNLGYAVPAHAQSPAHATKSTEKAAAKPSDKANSTEPKKPQAKLSREEELRAERMRMRGPAVLNFNASGKAIATRDGDLFLESKDGSSVQLTKTSGAEIAPQLTDDSRLVGYVREHALYVMNTDDLKETRLSPAAAEGLGYGEAEFVAQEEMDRFDGFWISPDSQLIVYQETDERQIPVYPIVHQGDTEWNVETHRYPFAGKANAKVRLGVVRTDGGPTKWLTLLPNDGEQYLGRVNWDSPGTFLVELLSRDHKRLKMLRVDAESGSNSVVLSESASDFINLHEDFRLVDAKTGEFVWATEASGFKQLELRSREGQVIRQLTGGPGAVDKVVRFVPERREVWYLGWTDSPLESHLFRVALDGKSPPVRLTKEPGMHSATVAADGESFTDKFSSFSQETTTIEKNRDGEAIEPTPTIEKPADAKSAPKDAEKPADSKSGPRDAEKSADAKPGQGLVENTPGLIDRGTSGAQLIEFKSRDGVTLFGCYYPPKNLKDGQKAPLIVDVYGGPRVQTVTNSWGLVADKTAEKYNAKGIAYWRMDNRGSMRRGKAFEAAIFRNMGDLEVKDQVDGVRHIAKLFPEIDTTRVGITGGSYGGYMTLRALTEAPETFHVGVSFAPVTDWDGYDTCYTERYMETPETNPDGYRRSSVLHRADRIQGKLLLIHGMIDENVHYRHTARMVQSLMAAKKPFELLAVPEGRHGFKRPADAAFAASKTVEFFEKHLLSQVAGQQGQSTNPKPTTTASSPHP